jgi:hypothetical protein
MVGAELKGMNVPIRLTLVVSMQNTSSGLNQSVFALDAGDSLEFASIQALFEEIRTHKVHIQYHSKSSTLQPVSTPSTTQLYGMGVMSVDATTPTALANVNDGFDASFHRLYDIAVVGTSGSIESRFNHTVKFTYKPPSAPFPNTNGFAGIPIAGSSWTSTAGTVTAGSSGVDTTGFLKFFEQNVGPTNTVVGVLCIEYDSEVRMRD